MATPSPGESHDAQPATGTSAEVTEAPYGTWQSPVSAESLVDQVVRLGQLQVPPGGKGRDVYWVESRPADGGREVIVRHRGGEVSDVIPPGLYARTRVHEYGGRCYAVHGETVVFSNWSDQRLWVVEPGADPRPLTAEPNVPGGARFADPVFNADGTLVFCVRERHVGEGEALNDLVALTVTGDGGAPVVVAEGHDFYAAPRVSPQGDRLCWVTWDHPDMPWDSTRLWVADLDTRGGLSQVRLVAGGPGESVTQPRWSPSGVLHYVSDRSGWWNIYDETGEPLCRMDAEFGRPDWVFGASTYGFTPEGGLVAVWESGGVHHLGRIGEGHVTEIPTPWSYFTAVEIAARDVMAIAASAVEPAAVVRIEADGSTETIRRSQEQTLERADISVPEHIRFPTGSGDFAFALVHRPANSRFRGPGDERPPVVVLIHGGPTSSALPVFDRFTQYWTTRGFVVANINYRGSTGYGRAYREKLNGNWGVSDVEDCAAAVEWLDKEGWADGARAVIRGGSAGGFTTLAALAFTDRFACGASLYGVGDVELLARHTHKFEARYLDSLIGPWPEEDEEYRRRSPIHNLDRFDRPVILFQGSEDAVVPPDQSRLMFERLTARGVDVEYVEYEGEQHGFRRAETIIDVATRELAFYRRVLGL